MMLWVTRSAGRDRGSGSGTRSMITGRRELSRHSLDSRDIAGSSMEMVGDREVVDGFESIAYVHARRMLEGGQCDRTTKVRSRKQQRDCSHR